MTTLDSHSQQETADIVIIGAGPAGSVAASLLTQQQHKVVVLEREQFPRFSIGESLLPQAMEFIQRAKLDSYIDQETSFQFKDGASFQYGEQSAFFDFTEKFSSGPGTTYQVRRGRFDQLLSEGAQDQGANIRFGHSVTELRPTEHQGWQLDVEHDTSLQPNLVRERYQITTKFILDASGFGRVLPRLLDLEEPSCFPSRTSLFTHIEDRIDAPNYDRNKILITVHPERRDVWFWLIPFADGRCSLGVVAEDEFFVPYQHLDNTQTLQAIVESTPSLSTLLHRAHYDTDVQRIKGYASNVKQLHGPGYALLGNAGEFLDPVFSSGVTIAMKSAALAAPLVSQQLKGGVINWETDYALPLKQGVDTFRSFVTAWYDGRFQDVIFSKNQTKTVRDMISSILAGYAWDTQNPFVAEPERRLEALISLCENQ